MFFLTEILKFSEMPQERKWQTRKTRGIRRVAWLKLLGFRMFFLWVSYGVSLVFSMVFNGFPWFSMVFNGFSMVSNCFSMVFLLRGVGVTREDTFTEGL